MNLPPIEPEPPPSVSSSKPIELFKAPSFELVVDNTGKLCGHGRVIVEVNVRRVVCGTCGAQLDTFDALAKMAKEHDRWKTRIMLTKRDIERLDIRLAALKTEEKNVVARLKRKGVAVPNVWERDSKAQRELWEKEKAEREAKKLKAAKGE